MYDGNIIDTHMHLWDLKNDYPWLETSVPALEYMGGNYDSLKRNFLVPDYLALTKSHRVTKSVHLEAFGFQGNPVAETAWLQQQADQYGFPHGIVAHADLHHPEIDTLLKQHCEYPNVRGMRMALNYHDNPLLCMTDRGDYLTDPAWRKGFALLSQYDLLFDLQIYDHQLADAVVLAKDFPDTQIIIEHFAWPLDLSEQGFILWHERIAEMARYSNVFMKLSGLGWVFKKSDEPSIEKYIHAAIQTFGADRCMFGSNFPADSLFYSYGDLMKIFKNAFSRYSARQQSQLFYETAERIYRL